MTAVRKKRRGFWWGGLIAFVVILPVALDAGCYSVFPTEAVKSKDPHGVNMATFIVQSAIVENDIWFFVLDSQPHGLFRSRTRLIGGSYSGDGSEKMKDAVWSSDGSICAVRGWLLGRGQNPASILYLDAYDFNRHQPVAHTMAYGTDKSLAIATLLAQRGGQSDTAIPYPGGGSQEPLRWWEALQYDTSTSKK